MATYSRVEVINAVLETGLVPIFNIEDTETAKNVINACADGGAKLVEFTNRSDFSFKVFSELAEYCIRKRPGVILGAGTILDAHTAALYMAGGANYIVSPAFVEETSRLCNRRKIPYIPGCATVTEISKAEESGVEICKLFPANCVGGPEFIKSILAPMPRTRIMVTGGVDATKENIFSWFRAGAACVGMGSKLLTREALESKRYADITAKVKEILGWIKEARGK